MRRALLALLLTGCASAPGSFACEHCACSPRERSAGRPVLCATVRLDNTCCALVLPSS